MFENTLRIVEEADLTYLHVFPYSPRPGTPAARMPQVDGGVARARAKRLRDARRAAVRGASARRGIGAIESVLVEKRGMGRTEQFVPVALESAVRRARSCRSRSTGVSTPTGLVGEAD